MTFKPAIWYPIAVVLSALNVVAVAFPPPVQPLHAMVHATLALAFGLWAQRLRRTRGSEPAARLEARETLEALDALEVEVSRLRQELSETQERLDFAERLLAQGPDARRVGPQR